MNPQTIAIVATLSNLFCAVAMLLQQRRHRKYRASIHAMLQDEGHAEGEAEMIVDEMLRTASKLGLKQPTLQEFGHALAQQRAFRRAVAHAELHSIYLETHGRSA